MEGHDGSINTTLGPPLLTLQYTFKANLVSNGWLLWTSMTIWKLSIHTELINSFINTLSFILCHSYSVIHTLSFILCHSYSVIHTLSFILCHSYSAIHTLSFILCHSYYVILTLSFILCHSYSDINTVVSCVRGRENCSRLLLQGYPVLGEFRFPILSRFVWLTRAANIGGGGGGGDNMSFRLLLTWLRKESRGKLRTFLACG
jgi:hypothetical protein